MNQANIFTCSFDFQPYSHLPGQFFNPFSLSIHNHKMCASFRLARCFSHKQKKSWNILHIPGRDKLFPRYHPHCSSKTIKLKPLLHLTHATNIPTGFYNFSIYQLQSVPFVLFLQQCSQSVTPHSCQVPKTRVSFTAFTQLCILSYIFMFDK